MKRKVQKTFRGTTSRHRSSEKILGETARSVAKRSEKASKSGKCESAFDLLQHAAARFGGQDENLKHAAMSYEDWTDSLNKTKKALSVAHVVFKRHCLR